MASLTGRIKQRAHELGFDLVGVATAGPSQTFDAYAGWLAHGYAGEMDYLARARNLARRRDLDEILPGARSVIAVAMNYAARERGSEGDKVTRWQGDKVTGSFEVTLSPRHLVTVSSGQVARYARNDDYHDVMLARLEALIDFMRAAAGPPVQARPYVDTGPVLEREWAQRAGLGWFGKNTNLIHPRLGSWLLLGEVVTDLALDPDPPFALDHCGTCTRCLDACPTDAFVSPRVLDARRCISYLTIELKGPIPAELRPLMGDWIFGCDVCQAVCPWNQKFARPTAEPAFQPRDDLAAPDLLALLALDDDSFCRRFQGSPIRRAKRRGLLRNVAVALGNSGNPTAVPALAQALHDYEPLVRRHAAWALGRIGSTGAQAALRQALPAEADPEVKDEIILALSEATDAHRELVPRRD
jgi:epoxyqueuosine reductase